ncbi:hypothetical protein [Streptomyces sp. NPDC048442]|uniref:hypothetical protein n=1 Tax=Streptomyces sp. NPDC048442 TaxID=3154823 RepID=UPI00341FD036
MPIDPFLALNAMIRAEVTRTAEPAAEHTGRPTAEPTARPTARPAAPRDTRTGEADSPTGDVG